MTPIQPAILTGRFNQLLASERRSLVRHAQRATPHLTPQTYRIWRDVRSQVDVSMAHERELSSLMDLLGIPERGIPFPSDVAFYHYVGVPTLLPLLIEEKRQQVQAYDQVMRHLDEVAPGTDLTGVHDRLKVLRDDNQRQLELLETHQATLPSPDSAALVNTPKPGDNPAQVR